MTPRNIPFLCGGIFFDLILQARKPRKKARDKQKGGTDGLADQDVMKGLVYVLTGDELNTYGDFSKCTSEYKTCKSSSNTYIPFEDITTVSAFMSALKEKDPDLQLRMSEFIDRFLIPSKHEWLVKTLIETIQKDSGIDRDTTFAVNLTHTVTVPELSEADAVELEIFLLSIFGYILQNRTDNSLGIDTFNSWFERKSERGEWLFANDKIGSSIKHKIIINRYQSNKSNTSETDSETDKQSTEYVEAEVLDDDSTFFSNEEKGQTTIIQNQTIIHHDESKTFNIKDSTVNFNL